MTARPRETARPRKIGGTPKVGRTPKIGGGSPETQKVGGTPQNRGETLTKRRDRKIGGGAKNRRDVGSGGRRGNPRKTEELDDGPSPPPPRPSRRWREADGMALLRAIRQSTTQRRPRRKEGFARWDGDVRRGRVDETKPAADEYSKVVAVAKGGDDR